MNMSLFDQVLNESYSADLGGYAEDSLSASEESYINDVITDDPVSLFQYTGECSNAIMALEAAEARMEGMMAVKLMNARATGDQIAMEDAVVTMEGFVGNVWETLKEIVKKAYAAVKAFLIKVWNKFKGYGNVVKAFFTKYGDVLRHKRVPGLRVKWQEINIMGAEKTYDKFASIIGDAMQKISNDMGAEINKHQNSAGADGSKYRHDKDIIRAASPANLVDDLLKRVSLHEINMDLEKEIYGDRNSDPESEKEFEEVRARAIEAADISSYKKYVDNFLALGNKQYQNNLKVLEDLKREQAKFKSAAEGAGVGSFHTQMRRILNANITLMNTCVHAMNQAAKHMQSQSIAACRKAIMYHATEGNGATYAGESYDASAADRHFDNIMGSLGY